MPQFTFQPSPKLTFQQAKGITDVFDADVDRQPKLTFQQPAAPKFTFMDKAKDFVSGIGKTAGDAAKSLGDNLYNPLKEKGNPIAKVGEAGSRVAGAAGDAFTMATAIPTAGASEAAKDTGAAKKLGTYVAGKMGGNPEEAAAVGKKLEDSTADVMGSSLVNAAAGAVGGKEVAAEKIASPAIKDGEKIYTGKDHEAIRQSMPEGSTKGADANTGFVTTKGRFIDRVEAQKMAKAQGQFDHEEKGPDELHSQELAPAASKESAPKTVADQLFRMSNKDVARRVDAKNTLKTIKGVDNATWEKLYAYKDDPKGVKLTPEEQALYDKHIKPVAERSTALRKELARKGVPFEEGDIGGAPRKVKGKNPLVERIYGNKAGEKAARAGSKLSTYSPTLRAREMWALPGKVGDRAIVFVRDGKIFKDGEQVGELMEGGTPTAGAETSVGKLEQATTSEIEKATNLEYHKNLLANEYLNWQSLERANDAADFLEAAKKNPEFLEFATNGKEAPESWRRLNVENKAFEGWKFDPQMAEVIEDYLGDAKSPEDFTKGVTNVAKAMRASIFYNPIRHMVNATNMFGTSLGAVKGTADLARGRLPVALMRATKNVLTQNKALRGAMDDGLSLPGMRNEANKFHEELIRAMGRSIQSDPQAFSRLAKEWGYKSTVGMMQALYRGSSKLLWAYSDILTDARYEMYKMDGLSSREAVRKTHQTMADYRIPSRVAGSRTLSKGLQNPAVTLFGRYDYNRMANLAGMARRAAKNDKAGWEARDQLLAVAAITTVGYKVVDKILQDATGEKDAHYGMGGYSTLVDDAAAVGTGRKSPAQAAMSAFSPGLLSTPLELLLNQNLYTGKPIMQRGDFDSFLEGGQRGTDAARMGYDAGSYLAEKFAPVQAVTSALTNDDPASKIIAEQLGGSFPKDSSRAEKYNRRAAKGAAKKRPEFVP